MYILSLAIRAFVVDEESFDENSFKDVKKAGIRMKLPIFVITLIVILMGICSNPIIEFLSGIPAGI